MSSLFICIKYFPMKVVAIDTTNSTAFLHKNLLSVRLRPISSKSSRNYYAFGVSNVLDSSSSFLGNTAEELELGSELSSEPPPDEDSSAVVASFLVNSCGFSPEKAFYISKHSNVKTPEFLNSNLNRLREYGFSQTQITGLLRRRPELIFSNLETTVFPNLHFFESVGVLKTCLISNVLKHPGILDNSLEYDIIPTYHYVKSLLQSDHTMPAIMKRGPWLLIRGQEKDLGPNIALLRKLEVPESFIVLLMSHFPDSVTQKHDNFEAVVNKVKKMGFDFSKTTAALALHALSGKSNQLIWKRNSESYRKWGWSDDDIMLAFRKQPHCMMLSGYKIDRTMEFLVKEMEVPAGQVAKSPATFCYSLEGRIKPRCSVVRVLMSKGLIEKPSLYTIMVPMEAQFLEKFVWKFKEEAPELLDVYQGKKNVLDYL